VFSQGGEEPNNDLAKAHPDPFLRSIGLWTAKDYSGSLATLVQSNVGEMVKKLSNKHSLVWFFDVIEYLYCPKYFTWSFSYTED
jgi:hypothetical protein